MPQSASGVGPTPGADSGSENDIANFSQESREATDHRPICINVSNVLCAT